MGHHYNELPEVTKLMYGRLPDQFAEYWMGRFPKLLIHSWMAMHCIKREPSFAKYFDKDYDFVKTFYRETLDVSKMSKTATLKPEQNLFMPNFTTKNQADLDEEMDSSKKSSTMSVISQWDKLPSADSDPDESFSEMKPTKNNLITTPVKKVIVNQLKSQNEELIKKPETWAKAVQGDKNIMVPGDTRTSFESPEKSIIDSCDNSNDEKENIIVKNDTIATNIPANVTVTNDDLKKNEENGDKDRENPINPEPIWIIPSEE